MNLLDLVETNTKYRPQPGVPAGVEQLDNPDSYGITDSDKEDIGQINLDQLDASNSDGYANDFKPDHSRWNLGSAVVTEKKKQKSRPSLKDRLREATAELIDANDTVGPLRDKLNRYRDDDPINYEGDVDPAAPHDSDAPGLEDFYTQMQDPVSAGARFDKNFAGDFPEYSERILEALNLELLSALDGIVQQKSVDRPADDSNDSTYLDLKVQMKDPISPGSVGFHNLGQPIDDMIQWEGPENNLNDNVRDTGDVLAAGDAALSQTRKIDEWVEEVYEDANPQLRGLDTKELNPSTISYLNKLYRKDPTARSAIDLLVRHDMNLHGGGKEKTQSAVQTSEKNLEKKITDLEQRLDAVVSGGAVKSASTTKSTKLDLAPQLEKINSQLTVAQKSAADKIADLQQSIQSAPQNKKDPGLQQQLDQLMKSKADIERLADFVEKTDYQYSKTKLIEPKTLEYLQRIYANMWQTKALGDIGKEEYRKMMTNLRRFQDQLDAAKDDKDSAARDDKNLGVTALTDKVRELEDKIAKADSAASDALLKDVEAIKKTISDLEKTIDAAQKADAGIVQRIEKNDEKDAEQDEKIDSIITALPKNVVDMSAVRKRREQPAQEPAVDLDQLSNLADASTDTGRKKLADLYTNNPNFTQESSSQERKKWATDVYNTKTSIAFDLVREGAILSDNDFDKMLKIFRNYIRQTIRNVQLPAGETPEKTAESILKTARMMRYEKQQAIREAKKSSTVKQRNPVAKAAQRVAKGAGQHKSAKQYQRQPKHRNKNA